VTLLDEQRPAPDGATDAEALIEEARQRQRKRRWFIGIIVLVVVAAGVWAASGSGSATRPPATSKKPGHIKTPASTPSTTVPASTAVGYVACGPDFFSGADQAFLLRWFGVSEVCMRAGNSDTWVDAIGGGVVRPVGPGGAVMLVETCAADDAACLDPDATRPLRDFTAYPAPDARTRLIFPGFVPERGTGVGPSCSVDCGVPARDGSLAVISDGSCNVDIFDLATDHWYFGTTQSGHQLAEGRFTGTVEIPSAPSFRAIQSPPPTPSPPPAICSPAGSNRA
jgi:hypothetical protein